MGDRAHQARPPQEARGGGGWRKRPSPKTGARPSWRRGRLGLLTHIDGADALTQPVGKGKEREVGAAGQPPGPRGQGDSEDRALLLGTC